METKTIQLERISHQKQLRLVVRFGFDDTLKQLVKQLEGALWSFSLKSWYVNDTPENLAKIYTLFNGKAEIDDTLLVAIVKLSAEAEEKIKVFTSWLKSKRYSPNTIKTYVDAIKTFLKFYANKPISEITNQDVIKFNNEYILAKNYSASFQNQVVHPVGLKN